MPLASAALAQSQAQARPEIEQQRRQAEQQAQQSLDRDAAASLEETQRAIKAIADAKTDEALAAIERASGKINVLLGRSPSTALIPVEVEVVVIDAAPRDVKAIRDVAKAAERAIKDRDYPQARVAKTAIAEAQAVRDKDRDRAVALLNAARNELERAKELGYAGNDPEYAVLNREISDVEKQLKGNQGTASVFSRLKEKIEAFFKRQSDTPKRSQPA